MKLISNQNELNEFLFITRYKAEYLNENRSNLSKTFVTSFFFDVLCRVKFAQRSMKKHHLFDVGSEAYFSWLPQQSEEDLLTWQKV